MRFQFINEIAISSMHQQSGAAEACWAHNPEVDGSKPSSANRFDFCANYMSIQIITS